MKVTRRSELSGVEHTMDLPTVTEERLQQCWRFNPNREGKNVQEVFTELNSDEREFLMTGITSEEWSKLFGTQDMETSK